MGLKIKDNVDLEELRKYGFKLGQEYADAGEKRLQGSGYAIYREWWHKFLMDPDESERIYYADDEYDQPMVQIMVRRNRDIYVDCTPSGTYHIGGEELDIVLETIMELTEAGLLEKTED